MKKKPAWGLIQREFEILWAGSFNVKFSYIIYSKSFRHHVMGDIFVKDHLNIGKEKNN